MLDEKHYFDEAHAKESVHSEIDTFVSVVLAPVPRNWNENWNHERREDAKTDRHESCFLLRNILRSHQRKQW